MYSSVRGGASTPGCGSSDASIHRRSTSATGRRYCRLQRTSGSSPPRNGETFYVGEGQTNRAFAHISDEQSLTGDQLNDKLKRIRELRPAAASSKLEFDA
jgi:hypothetical protein